MQYHGKAFLKHHNFIHHKRGGFLSSIREIIFGAEDGMVSTLGALTGIAASVGDQFIVVLSGFVIIAVESIAMSIGSYLSSKSTTDVAKRMIKEKEIEFDKQSQQEQGYLKSLYIRDGWPESLADTMVVTAARDKKHFVREIAFRELNISTTEVSSPIRGGLFMFLSYVIGGFVPIVAYLFIPIPLAILFSITLTLSGLFLLGSLTGRFTGRKWWKAGFEMLILASLAAGVGYGIGQVVDFYFGI